MVTKYRHLNPTVIFENDCVTALEVASDSLLLLVWKRQISFSERKDTFLWGLEYSETHGLKNWLIDDEALFIITTEEKEWVTHAWTELVATSGIAKIAVLIAENFPNQHTNLDFTESAIKQYERHGQTQHQVFTDLEVALAWLKGNF